MKKVIDIKKEKIRTIVIHKGVPRLSAVFIAIAAFIVGLLLGHI
jgi:hypothetical protein